MKSESSTGKWRLSIWRYGVYKSAEQAPKKLQYFGVKTVVDLADSAKGDTYHEYGSILSVLFAIEAIKGHKERVALKCDFSKWTLVILGPFYNQSL
jgi:hypothetical protein